jgi:hypothetical protein
MFRPRDILYFCTTILEELNRRNKTIVDKEILLEAEKFHSDYLLRSLSQEYKVGYPDIEEICLDIFMSKAETVYESQLKKRIATYPDLLIKYDIDEIIRFCFESGTVGIKIAKTEYFSYKGYEYDTIINTAKKYGAIQFIVHPGLNKILDIKTS